jgi:hypothetical protein
VMLSPRLTTVRCWCRLGSRGGAVATRPTVRAGGCRTAAPDVGAPGKERSGTCRPPRPPCPETPLAVWSADAAPADYPDCPERLGVRAPLPSPAQAPSADARRSKRAAEAKRSDTCAPVNSCGMAEVFGSFGDGPHVTVGRGAALPLSGRRA